MIHSLPNPNRTLLITVALILIGAVLRLGGLDRSPLRGDEAFTVRYWADFAAIPALSTYEPHPIGAFYTFAVWKALAGDSEFAMRTLPALINLLGIPAIIGLGVRLFRRADVAYLAGLLWAINPGLIWHSQDVRNYAIWSALSAVTLLALVRAVHSRNRRGWMVYVVFAVLGLYTFFLEGTMLIVHALYAFLIDRKTDQKTNRKSAFRRWIITCVVIGILCIPLALQVLSLATSGYRGSSMRDPAAFAMFPLYLLFGEAAAQDRSIYVVLLLAVVAAFVVWRNRRNVFLLVCVGVPLMVVLLAAARLDVLWARYLLATVPALLLLVAYGIRTPPSRLGVLVAVLVFGYSAQTYLYSVTDYHKAPDWYGLRDYLAAHVQNGDVVIAPSLDPSTGNLDPGFDYYLPDLPRIVLPHPELDTEQTVRDALNDHRAVWEIVSGGGTTDAALRTQGMLISDQGAGRSFLVRQYRATTPKLDEITEQVSLSVGGGVLNGYSVERVSETGWIVLLFWDRAPDLTTFVHVTRTDGTFAPDGSPLWAQSDHPPNVPPGLSGRDLYPLTLSASGEYVIRFGMYDSAGTRIPIRDEAGNEIGTDYALISPFVVR